MQERKLNAFTRRLQVNSFISKDFSSEKRNKLIKSLYDENKCGDPLYYDVWKKERISKKLPAEIKDFRASKEYDSFKKQLHLTISKIKEICKQRLGDDAYKDIEFKSLDALYHRFIDPNIVTDTKRDGISEAELSYSEGKRSLEGILDNVMNAPTDTVKNIIKALLNKEKGQTIENLEVCASGTRQNLEIALREFPQSNEAINIISEFDNALLTTLQQEADLYLKTLTPKVPPGMMIHLNATLVNFTYSALNLQRERNDKVKDPLAPKPGLENKITYPDNPTIRIGITEKEATQFAHNLERKANSIIFSIIDSLCLLYQRDMTSFNSLDAARFFIEKLVSIAGSNQNKYDVDKLLNQFFGYYQIKKLKYKENHSLNEVQIDEINKYGINEVLSQLEKNNEKGSDNYIKELKELCDFLTHYPKLDGVPISESLLKIYKSLKYELLDKTLIREQLDATQKTTNLHIVKYLRSQLLAELAQYPSRDDKSEKRNKMLNATLSRLKETNKTDTTPEDEKSKNSKNEHLFEEEKAKEVRIEVDMSNAELINTSQYCSLDQIHLDEEKNTTIKTPDDIRKLLTHTLFDLMVDGNHILASSFIRSSYIPNSNYSFNFILDNLEFSRVLIKKTEGNEYIPFTDYFKTLIRIEQYQFLTDFLERITVPIDIRIIFNCFKLMHPTPAEKTQFFSYLTNWISERATHYWSQIKHSSSNVVQEFIQFGIVLNQNLGSENELFKDALTKTQFKVLKMLAIEGKQENFDNLLQNKIDINSYNENKAALLLFCLNNSIRKTIPLSFFRSLLVDKTAYDIPDAKGDTVLKIAANIFIEKSYNGLSLNNPDVYLMEIFKHDNGAFFERFKQIYSEKSQKKNPLFSFFQPSEMEAELAKETINSMSGVVDYVKKYPSSTSATILTTLAEEIISDKLTMKPTKEFKM